MTRCAPCGRAIFLRLTTRRRRSIPWSGPPATVEATRRGQPAPPGCSHVRFPCTSPRYESCRPGNCRRLRQRAGTRLAEIGGIVLQHFCESGNDRVRMLLDLVSERPTLGGDSSQPTTSTTGSRPGCQEGGSGRCSVSDVQSLDVDDVGPTARIPRGGYRRAKGVLRRFGDTGNAVDGGDDRAVRNPDLAVDAVVRPPGPNRQPPLADASDAGMSTVEYAVGTVVAAAFAAVLYKIVTGDSVVAGLTNLINSALSTTF